MKKTASRRSCVVDRAEDVISVAECDPNDQSVSPLPDDRTNFGPERSDRRSGPTRAGMPIATLLVPSWPSCQISSIAN